MGARKAVAQAGHNNADAHGKHYHKKEGPARPWAYVPPYFIWLAILGVALLGRYFWALNQWFTFMATVMVVLWVWVAARMTRHLNDVLRLLACGTIVVIGMFIITVNIMGATPVLVSLWGGFGFAVCVAWTIRKMLLPEFEKGQRQASPMAQRLIDALGGAQLGSPKRQMIEGELGEADSIAGPIRVPLTVNRGEQTMDELKHMPETIETIAGMRPGAARIVRDRKDAGKGELVINPVDLLEGTVPWRGPSAFGESIALPVPVGRYASTNLAQIHIVGDEAEGRNLVQWLVMGMTGAAKSFSIRTLMADLSTRKKVTIWAHDHVKGLQTLRPLIEGGALDWVTMTKADGQAMLSATRLVIQARARWLGMKGFDQWSEDCGLNALVVWLEEAADLAQMKVLLQLVREARSVGVIIFISLQRASHTTLDTDTRAQLAGNICFGVESETDAKFGLPTHVIDAGAAPERWRADMPGYCYISAPGISQEQQAEELRWFLSTKEQLVDACKRGAAVRTPLMDEPDQVTIKAAGNVYMKRIPSEAFCNPQHPLFGKAIGMDIGKAVQQKNTTDGEDMDDDETVGSGAGSMGNSSSGSADVSDLDDDDDNDALDTHKEEAELEKPIDIPDCPDPDMQAGKIEYQKLSTEDCKQRVQNYIQAIDAQGKAFVTVPDVQKMRPPIPRGREWLRAELKRLAGLADGEIPDASGFRLERDDDMDAGTYRIVPPVREGVPVGAQPNGRA